MYLWIGPVSLSVSLSLSLSLFQTKTALWKHVAKINFSWLQKNCKMEKRCRSEVTDGDETPSSVVYHLHLTRQSVESRDVWSFWLSWQRPPLERRSDEERTNQDLILLQKWGEVYGNRLRRDTWTVMKTRPQKLKRSPSVEFGIEGVWSLDQICRICTSILCWWRK